MIVNLAITNWPVSILIVNGIFRLWFVSSRKMIALHLFQEILVWQLKQQLVSGLLIISVDKWYLPIKMIAQLSKQPVFLIMMLLAKVSLCQENSANPITVVLIINVLVWVINYPWLPAKLLQLKQPARQIYQINVFGLITLANLYFGHAMKQV